MSLPFKGQFALRHRSVWEAADSGLLLWRKNFFLFLPFFAFPFWTFAFVLRLLPGNLQYLSWLVLWLLKPFFDRIILHIISIQFFENGADLKRLCRGLGKSLTRGLLGDLLWRRFSPLRSAIMPLRVLEPGGTQWRKIAQRKNTLKKGGLGFGFYLTGWGLALEATLLLGEILFFVVMAEIIRGGFIASFGNFFMAAEVFIFAAWCFNYMLVETIYVCMGFALYINSRVEVEGWDIEILFRSLGEKIKSKKAPANPIVLFFLFLTAGIFLPEKIAAQSPPPPAVPELVQTENVPMDELERILASPDFGGVRETWGIRLRNPRQPRTRETSGFDFNPAFERLREIFALALRLILIAAISGLLVFLILYIRKFSKEKSSQTDNPAMAAMFVKSTESPESLLDKAVDFFERGNMRLAWGYCAAAAVNSWSLYKGLAFPRDATENDCIDLVNASEAAKEDIQAFSELIKSWVNLAYAGEPAPHENFARAVAFCKYLKESPPQSGVVRLN